MTDYDLQSISIDSLEHDTTLNSNNNNSVWPTHYTSNNSGNTTPTHNNNNINITSTASSYDTLPLLLNSDTPKNKSILFPIAGAVSVQPTFNGNNNSHNNSNVYNTTIYNQLSNDQQRAITHYKCKVYNIVKYQLITILLLLFTAYYISSTLTLICTFALYNYIQRHNNILDNNKLINVTIGLLLLNGIKNIVALYDYMEDDDDKSFYDRITELMLLIDVLMLLPLSVYHTYQCYKTSNITTLIH